MEKLSKILVTGASGLVGTALLDALKRHGYENVMGISSKDCNLLNAQETLNFFKANKPDYVFHMAAAVFGIMGNMKNKALSFRDNTLINMNVIEGAVSVGVKKMTCMGSGCVYPYPSPGLPLNEDMIWMGAPHASEDSYAHSKRAMLAQLNAYKESYGLDFAFVISGNLYGPHDKFDTEYGHVTPSLVRKFYEASLTGEEIVVWGDGSAQRDFMFSEDTGEALIAIMKSVLGSVNMGSGAVNSIRDIVDILADITGGQAQIVWDSSKPNGQDYRAYNLDKLSETGFKPNVCLREGLEKTYAWYKEHADKARK